MSAAGAPGGRGPRLRAAMAGALVLASLWPMRETTAAVLYCVLGPWICLAAGSVLSATPLGPPLAARVSAGLAGLGRLVLGARAVAFQLVVAALCLGLGSASALFVLEASPGIIDSALYLFEAKVLASGSLAAPAPAMPEFFDVERMMVDGERWYSVYPPGYPLLLALGVLLGVPSLVNPALCALNAVLVYQLARRLGSEGEARGAALIAGLSPFVILMSSDYTSHPTSLVAATGFLLAVTIAVRQRSARARAHWASWSCWVCWACAGFAGALCFAARPYTAASLCLVFALVGVAHIVRQRDWRAALAGLAGASLPLGFVVVYNLATTGDPLLFGYAKLYSAAHLPGFGETLWGVHTPWRGLVHTLTNLNALNKDLLQLPLPALALVGALFAFGRPTRWDAALLLSFASLVAFHFFYGYQSLYLGPKFLFDGVSIVAILAARGAAALARAVPWSALPERRRRILLLAGFVAVFAVFPAVVARRMAAVRAGYSDPTIVRAVGAQGIEDAVVFCPYEAVSRFASCFAENVPTLDGPVVWARDRGEENPSLARAYPGRQLYRWSDGRLERVRPAAAGPER